ncbi:hypothetical protein [Streptomyces sp. NPDC001500]
MDTIFWLGLVLGAVFGVGVDLWKRPLDRLLDRRLERRTQRRGEVLAQRTQQDRSALRDDLVEVILQTTLVGSLIGILAGIAFGVTNLLAWMHPESHAVRTLNAVLSAVGQILSIIGAGYIVRIAGDALAVARRVSQSREIANPAPRLRNPDPPDPENQG